jgi:hypothetical protein
VRRASPVRSNDTIRLAVPIVRPTVAYDQVEPARHAAPQLTTPWSLQTF